MAQQAEGQGWGNLLDKFKDPPGTWECKACLVKNKDANAKKCVSCESERDDKKQKVDKAASSAGAGDLSAMFKVAEGSWTCSACLVSNPDAKATKCVACETDRPGYESAKPKPAITAGGFSMSTNGSNGSVGVGGFTFNPTTTGNGTVPATGFTFNAAPNSSSNGATVPATGFTFNSTTASTSAPSASATPAVPATGFTFNPTAAATKSSPAKPASSPAKVKQQLPTLRKSKGGKKAAGLSLTPCAKGGQMFTVGSGECGQLGQGVDDDHLTALKPNRVKGLSDVEITRLAAGPLHNVAVKKNGEAVSWGCNDDACLGRDTSEQTGYTENFPGSVAGIDEEIIQVACGDCHSVFLTKSGTVYACGTYKNSNGLLGFSPTEKKQATPAQVKGLPNVEKDPVVQVASGCNHTCAVTKSGKLYVWGDAECGQLGRKVFPRFKQKALIPSAAVSFPRVRKRKSSSDDRTPSTKVNRVFCTGYSTFALMESGHVYAWGLNSYGQLGLGEVGECEIQPTMIDGFTFPDDRRIVHICGGMHFTIALDDSGYVYAFGRPDNGVFANGRDGSKDDVLTEPEVISSMKEHFVSQIACGGTSVLAITDEGVLYTWGFGECGQLANGEEKDEYKPFKVVTKNRQVIQVDGGEQHTVILAAAL